MLVQYKNKIRLAILGKERLERLTKTVEKNPKNFYLIDGHLNQVGHIQIADKLSRLF